MKYPDVAIHGIARKSGPVSARNDATAKFIAICCWCQAPASAFESPFRFARGPERLGDMISFGRAIGGSTVPDRLRIDLGRQLHAKALTFAPGDLALRRPAVGQEDDDALSHGEVEITNITDQYVDLAKIGMTNARLQQPALALIQSLGGEIGIRNGHFVPYLFNLWCRDAPLATLGSGRHSRLEPFVCRSRPSRVP